MILLNSFVLLLVINPDDENKILETTTTDT